jgi:phosphoribosylanthranilate isomerase
MVAVKICGITERSGFEAARDAKAEFVGFVFFPRSSRYVTPEQAAAVAGGAKDKRRQDMKVVAVTADAEDSALDEIALALSPDCWQLHGKESLGRVAAIRRRFPGAAVIKAQSVRSGDDAAAALSYAAHADMLLFDARLPSSDVPGGHGVSFDWHLLAGREIGVPWFLAGGLNADNLAEAVAVTGARFVDVSSGLETAPGKKNPGLIRNFIEKAHAL